jgi:hypothetical protein
MIELDRGKQYVGTQFRRSATKLANCRLAGVEPVEHLIGITAMR